jgi:hypothetical protein
MLALRRLPSAIWGFHGSLPPLHAWGYPSPQKLRLCPGSPFWHVSAQNLPTHSHERLAFYTSKCKLAMLIPTQPNAPHQRPASAGPLVGSGNGALDTGFSPFAPYVVQECLTASPYPGFHPLPHRTGHEVFPHPALRQSSSWSFQGFEPLDRIWPVTSSPAQWLSILLALKHSPRWSCRDLSMGVIGPIGACTVTYLPA